MSQPRDDRQDDLFRPALEEIINLRHPLMRLAAEIDWGFLAGRFGSVCRAGPGQPPLPTRLVAGLFILKHMHNLSDEMLCDRWVENPAPSTSAARCSPRGAVRCLAANAL
jgi:IS5 family transposase